MKKALLYISLPRVLLVNDFGHEQRIKRILVLDIGFKTSAVTGMHASVQLDHYSHLLAVFSVIKAIAWKVKRS